MCTMSTDTHPENKGLAVRKTKKTKSKSQRILHTKSPVFAGRKYEPYRTKSPIYSKRFQDLTTRNSKLSVQTPTRRISQEQTVDSTGRTGYKGFHKRQSRQIRNEKICRKRITRRQILFITGKAGKGKKPNPRRLLTPDSKVRC